MSLPTVEDIVRLYLYGQETTPNLISKSVIRDSVTPVSIDVDAREYMSTGAGRFAIGAQFELVRGFFNANISELPPGIYTKSQVATIFGLTSYAFNPQQYDFQDSTDDYAARTFIYGSTAFKINDNAQFIVYGDGSKEIKNFNIKPILPTDTPPVQENFDFNSSNGLTKVLNNLLRPVVDPSKLGRTVNINFTNVDSLSLSTYTFADYNRDIQNVAKWSNTNFSKLESDGVTLLNNLFNEGITRFLDDHGRPILYGTTGNDTIDASNASNIWTSIANTLGVSNISQYKDNGVALIGGAGADRLTGGSHNDILYGGLDGDTLNGGAGQDTADYSLATGILGVSVTMLGTSGTAQAWNGNAVVGTGTDSLSSIEIVQGTASSDRFSGGNSEVTFIGGSGSDLYNVTWGGAMPKIVELAGDSGTDAISVPSGVTPGNYERMDSGDGGYILTPKDGVSGAAYTIPANIENVAYATGGQTAVLAFPEHKEPPPEADNPNDAHTPFHGAQTAHPPPGGDPLVLDLGTQGIGYTVGHGSGSVYWDIDDDGFREQVSWVGPEDGFLALDRNGNGTIDNNSELFGDQPASGVLNGFAQLAALDTNHDHRITSADAQFSSLKVWIDATTQITIHRDGAL